MRLLGVVLAGALLTPAQAHAAPPPATTITLITGDQVLTSQRAVRPAPGREHVSFTTYTAQGHEFVVPDDALPMVANGRLDERLFDVTELATYDGALPVIVTYPEGTVSTQPGVRLRGINGVAFDAAKTPLAGGLSSAGKIWLDARRRASLDRGVRQINALADGSATATVTAGIAEQPDGGAVVASGLHTALVDLERESYDVKITGIDRSGATASSTFAFLIDVDTGARVWPDPATGVARLAKGRYLLTGSVLSTGTHDVISYPDLTITGATTITLDARLAKPVRVTLPVPARLSLLQTGFERVVNGTSYTIGNFSVGGDIDHLGVASLGPDSAEVTGKTATFWTAGADFYGLAWYQRGHAPNGLTKTVLKRNLATVEVDLPPLKDGQSATVGHTSAPEGRADRGYGPLDTLAPGPHTEYYGGEGGDWSRRLNLFGPNGNTSTLATPLRHYKPGRSYVEHLDRAVFGPALPETRDTPHTFRTGDLMHVTIPLYGDNAGNEGYSPVSSARTTVYRDDVKVAETPEAGRALLAVEPGAADYRVETTAGRDTPLSSKVSGVWTFRSDTTAKQTALPLSVIRYTPQLDDDGYAAAGRMLAVPVSVQSQAGSVRITSAEVSYDGGTTWRHTPVTHDRLLLAHPANARSVSLRAKAAGPGQTVEQTVIDAYLLR